LLLSKLTIPAHDIEDFDELKIPFRCVATELETGRAKVFKSGDLARALRASMSLPSIFEPVVIDGITYIDGAMVRNLPVQDVLDMGADFTIAVDVSSDLYKSYQVKTALDMLDQSISYRINESNQAQRKQADIIIKPDMTGINGFSFNQIDTLLKRGEDAARKALPEIRARLQKRNRYSNPVTVNSQIEQFEIESLRIQGMDRKRQQVIKDILSLHKGEQHSVEKLEESLTQVYTQGWVRQIYYKLREEENKKYTLEIDAVPAPSSWLKMGVNYDSDLKAGILLGAEKRHFLLRGSKLSGDFRVSENPMGQIDFDVNNLFFANTGIKLQARANFSPAFAYVRGRKVNEFKFHRFSLGSSIYTHIFKNGLLSAGIYREQFTQNRQLYEPSKDETRLTQTVLPISFNWDTYDRLHFPLKGFQFHIHTSWTLNGRLERISEGLTFDLSKTNYLIRSYYNQVWPLSHRWAMVCHLDWGTVNYEVNSNVYAFYLGRSLQGEQTHVSFTGLKYMGQVASQYGMGRMQLRWEIKKDIFMSLTGNYGFAEGVLRRQMTRQELFGGGIEWGARTAIGPVRFSVEYGNIHPDVVMYLHIGHVF
jgi:NTE family protein